MPRDCTVQPVVTSDGQSPQLEGIPYNSMTKSTKRAQAQQNKQLTRMIAPVASSGVVKPSSYTITTTGPGQVRVRGHELLGPVTILGEGPVVIGAIFDANPSCWVTSRLALISRTYEKYRYNRARISFVSASSTTTSGSLLIAVETDPDEPIPATANGMARAMNNQFSAMGPVWGNFAIDYARVPSDLAFYTASQINESSRQVTSQFIAYALTNNTTLNLNLGNMLIEYDIEFAYPELENVDGGRQYFGENTVSFLSAAANAAITVDSTTITGLLNTTDKIIELRPLSNLVSSYVINTGDWYDIAKGYVMYLAYSGATWTAFATLEAAKTGTLPLKWTNAVPATPIPAFMRVLVSGLSSR